MQIRVREMSARCRCCGGIEFTPVGEEVMKQANAFIAVHKAIADKVKSPCPN